MTVTIVLGATTLSITAILCFSALRAWRGWLELKQCELDRGEPAEEQASDVGVRIELAAVRERLKRLEAIASGVEL